MKLKDPLELFRFYEIIEAVSKIIRSSKKPYFIEIDDKGGRYISELDPWEMPVSADMERVSLRAGNALKIELIETRRGNGLNIKYRDINLTMQDLGKHKIVELDDTNAVVFREDSRWIVFLGASSPDYSKNMAQIDRVFEAMKAKNSKPKRRPVEEVSFGF